MWKQLTTMQKCYSISGYCTGRCVRSHLLTCTITRPDFGCSTCTASTAEETNVLTLTPEIYCQVLTTHGSTIPRASTSKDATWGHFNVWPFVQLQFRSLDNWEMNFFWVGNQDSVNGITTLYGLDGPRFEPQLCWGFLYPSKSSLGSTQPSLKLVPIFRG
jgi:hypothetical protein